MWFHYTREAAADNAVRERGSFWSWHRDVSPGDCSKPLMSIGSERKSEPFATLALLMGKVNCGIKNIL
jgi:hypothetical protein